MSEYNLTLNNCAPSYRKTVLFADHKTADLILATDGPEKAKALGRRINDFEDSIWILNRFEIVVEGSALKLGSDSSLLANLLNSSPAV